MKKLENDESLHWLAFLLDFVCQGRYVWQAAEHLHKPVISHDIAILTYLEEKYVHLQPAHASEICCKSAKQRGPFAFFIIFIFDENSKLQNKCSVRNNMPSWSCDTTMCNTPYKILQILATPYNPVFPLFGGYLYSRVSWVFTRTVGLKPCSTAVTQQSIWSKQDVYLRVL